MQKIILNMRTGLVAGLCILSACQFTSCSDDDAEKKIDLTGQTVTSASNGTKEKTVYILNEGNMGKNNASLDCFDYQNGKYYLSLFSAVNPKATLGLGDTGNDLQVYDGKLYAVINGSNLIEVTDLSTGKETGTVSIPSPRNITFSSGYAYITSYSNPGAGSETQPKGSVYKVNLKTLAIEGNAVTGYQPEGIAYSDGRLFVANSGGYMYPHYEHSVSVVDASSMKVTGSIDCGLNLGHVALGSNSRLYVISQGNYSTVNSMVYVIDTRTLALTDSIDTRVSAMAVEGDSLYIIGTEYKAPDYTPSISYTLYNILTGKKESKGFISDGTESQITMPYTVAVSPYSGDIFVTDAGDYKTPGRLFCYSRDGKMKWKATTGIIPGHIAFSTVRLRGLE